MEDLNFEPPVDVNDMLDTLAESRFDGIVSKYKESTQDQSTAKKDAIGFLLTEIGRKAVESISVVSTEDQDAATEEIQELSNALSLAVQYDKWDTVKRNLSAIAAVEADTAGESSDRLVGDEPVIVEVALRNLISSLP